VAALWPLDHPEITSCKGARALLVTVLGVEQTPAG
jgi:hypothetical protein